MEPLHRRWCRPSCTSTSGRRRLQAKVASADGETEATRSSSCAPSATQACVRMLTRSAGFALTAAFSAPPASLGITMSGIPICDASAHARRCPDRPGSGSFRLMTSAAVAPASSAIEPMARETAQLHCACPLIRRIGCPSETATFVDERANASSSERDLAHQRPRRGGLCRPPELVLWNGWIDAETVVHDGAIVVHALDCPNALAV